MLLRNASAMRGGTQAADKPPPGRREQASPEGGYELKWGIPSGGFRDNGGPLSELHLGHDGMDKRKLSPIFEPQADPNKWSLGWMIPPGTTFERLNVQDLFWEQVIVNVMAAAGGSLSTYAPQAFPDLPTIVHDLGSNGFPPRTITSGEAQTLGAWTMDLCWTELNVATGISRGGIAYDAVGNYYYKVLAEHMAQQRRTTVATQMWHCLEAPVEKAEKIGNIFETYATLLLLRGDWGGLATMLFMLASLEGGQLTQALRLGTRQEAPPVGPPLHADGSVDPPSGGETGRALAARDRKSTRLNSSHSSVSRMPSSA